MIIKKLAKLCRERECLAYTYNDDQMWAGVQGECMYLLSGIEVMGVDSLECVFDWSEKQKRKVQTALLDFAEISDEIDDVQFPEHSRTAYIIGENYRIFKHRGRLYFIPEVWFDPIRDKLDSGECNAFLRIRGEEAPELIVIKRGFIDIAVFNPAVMSKPLVSAWIEENRGLIRDIEMDMSEKQLNASEQPERENSQMEMGSDGDV